MSRTRKSQGRNRDAVRIMAKEGIKYTAALRKIQEERQKAKILMEEEGLTSFTEALERVKNGADN